MSNDLLLIVDVQKGLMNEHTRHLPNLIMNFVKRTNFNKIILTKFINTPDSSFVKLLGWNKMMANDPNTNIVDTLVPIKAKTYDKNTYTALTTEILQYIKSNNIKIVYLAGIDSDACVLKTAYDLFDNGISFKIIVDLCASSSKNKDMNRFAIEILKRNIGEKNIITAKDYLIKTNAEERS